MHLLTRSLLWSSCAIASQTVGTVLGNLKFWINIHQKVVSHQLLKTLMLLITVTQEIWQHSNVWFFDHSEWIVITRQSFLWDIQILLIPLYFLSFSIFFCSHQQFSNSVVWKYISLSATLKLWTTLMAVFEPQSIENSKNKIGTKMWTSR